MLQALIAKTGIRVLIVLTEIGPLLDEQSVDKGAVADTVAANPGIEERQGENENQAQEEP